MSTNARVLLASILFALASATAFAADDPAARALASKIKAELRAVENAHDAAVIAERLGAAEKMLLELRAAYPAHSELAAIEGRFRRCAGRPAGAPPKPEPAAPPPVDAEAEQQARRDWEAMVKLYKDFDGRLRPIVPHDHAVIFDASTIDGVVATLAQLRAEVPAIRAKLDAFAAKYGADVDAIDRKLFELTPDNPRKSRLDPENQRPDGSAGRAYADLLKRMGDLQNAPAYAARLELNQAIEGVDRIRTFVMDTERDKRLAEVEARVGVAAKLNPDDAEVRAWQAKIGQIRRQTAADIGKALDAARFPGHAAGFAGPGNPASLAKAALEYFNKANPKEKAVAATVAGDWTVTKRNLLGEPIQWGLPVHVAAEQGADRSVVRVFRMTVLAEESRDAKKAPPFVDHWTGDSYRMRAAHLP